MDTNDKDSLEQLSNTIIDMLKSVYNVGFKAGVNSVKSVVYCSFCGNSQEEVKTIVSSGLAYICDECILEAQKILEDDKVENKV